MKGRQRVEKAGTGLRTFAVRSIARVASESLFAVRTNSIAYISIPFPPTHLFSASLLESACETGACSLLRSATKSSGIDASLRNFETSCNNVCNRSF
jgi:hypothetical protein